MVIQPKAEISTICQPERFPGYVCHVRVECDGGKVIHVVEVFASRVPCETHRANRTAWFACCCTHDDTDGNRVISPETDSIKSRCDGVQRCTTWGLHGGLYDKRIIHHNCVGKILSQVI